MSMVAQQIDKAVMIGTLEAGDIANDDFISFYDSSATSGQRQKKTTLSELKNKIGGGLPVATAADIGKPVIAGANGYVLGETATATENFLIAPTDWQPLTGNEPYLYYADKTPRNSLGVNAEVELINNDPALFAQYGFAVLPVIGQTVRFAAVEAPLSRVILRCRFYA